MKERNTSRRANTGGIGSRETLAEILDYVDAKLDDSDLRKFITELTRIAERRGLKKARRTKKGGTPQASASSEPAVPPPDPVTELLDNVGAAIGTAIGGLITGTTSRPAAKKRVGRRRTPRKG